MRRSENSASVHLHGVLMQMAALEIYSRFIGMLVQPRVDLATAVRSEERFRAVGADFHFHAGYRDGFSVGAGLECRFFGHQFSLVTTRAGVRPFCLGFGFHLSDVLDHNGDLRRMFIRNLNKLFNGEDKDRLR